VQYLLGQRRGWTPIAVSVEARDTQQEQLLELAEQHHWQLINLDVYGGELPSDVAFAGALVTGLPADKLVRALQRRRVPTVRIGRLPHEMDRSVPAVILDLGAVGRVAAEHFAQRDFEDVLFLKHPTWNQYEPIYEGFARRAEALGLTCHLRRLKAPGRRADAWSFRREYFLGLLSELPRPVGLLASSDRTASRYARWALEAGLKVPEDLAVLGINNNRFLCRSAPVSISSVAHDWPRVMATAVGVLANSIRGDAPAQPTTPVPPIGVMTRQSTDVLAASDPNVAAALRFIWDHVTEDLTVEQVARHVGVSRRTLERAFQSDLGRGVYQEFKRRRLDKARELLTHTDLPIAEVAATLSFSSHTYFGQLFRQAYGLSPARYRQQRGAAG